MEMKGLHFLLLRFLLCNLIFKWLKNPFRTSQGMFLASRRLVVILCPVFWWQYFKPFWEPSRLHEDPFHLTVLAQCFKDWIWVSGKPGFQSLLFLLLFCDLEQVLHLFQFSLRLVAIVMATNSLQPPQTLP